MIRKFSFYLLLLTLGFVSSAWALQWTAVPTVEQFVRKIELAQGNWIFLKAKTRLHFLNAAEQSATCSGDLIYDRLSEKLVLKCFNKEQKLLFAFKTHDREFQLFVPGNQTMFQGDIFDLDLSEQVESHLKPLYLYRALKVPAIPVHQTRIENYGKDSASLTVYEGRRRERYLARRLVITEEGKVSLEVYYDPAETPRLNIHRSQFRPVHKKNPLTKKNILFPYQITIEDLGAEPDSPIKETVFRFEEVSFVSFLDESEWNLELPADTRVKDISEQRQTD